MKTFGMFLVYLKCSPTPFNCSGAFVSEGGRITAVVVFRGASAVVCDPLVVSRRGKAGLPDDQRQPGAQHVASPVHW